MNKEIFTTKNRKWNLFLSKLETAVNIQGSGKSITWTCVGNYKMTVEILKEFPEINIQNTLEYFRSLGGCCDCEILFNIH